MILRGIDVDYRIKIIDDYYNKTISQILDECNCKKDGVVFLKAKEGFIFSLDYYYNDIGQVEYYKKITDVPICKLSDYDIDIGDSLEISFVDGLGSSTGGMDFFTVYDQIENFVTMHPLLFAVGTATLSYAMSKLKTIFKKQSLKCDYDVFKKALLHKKELTPDEVIWAFGLDDCKKNNKDDIAAIEILLEYHGYEYDDDLKKWVLK